MNVLKIADDGSTVTYLVEGEERTLDRSGLKTRIKNLKRRGRPWKGDQAVMVEMDDRARISAGIRKMTTSGIPILASVREVRAEDVSVMFEHESVTSLDAILFQLEKIGFSQTMVNWDKKTNLWQVMYDRKKPGLDGSGLNEPNAEPYVVPDPIAPELYEIPESELYEIPENDPESSGT